jgi:hypothetical protein
MVELDDDEALLIEGGVTVRLAAQPAARASEAARAMFPRVPKPVRIERVGGPGANGGPSGVGMGAVRST